MVCENPRVTASPFRTIVVAHGGLAAALADTARLIVGAASDLVAVDLDADETPEAFAERLRAAMPPDGRAALVLTDLLGGTPHNVAMALRSGAALRLLSGANLPVLLEAITATEPLSDALVERLVDTGRRAVRAIHPDPLIPRPTPVAAALE